VAIFHQIDHFLTSKGFLYCGAATQRGSWPPHSRGF